MINAGLLHHAAGHDLSDCIALPRDPFLVNAQNVLQIAHKGHEIRSLLGGVQRESSVVLGQMDLAKPAIGRFDRLDHRGVRQRRRVTGINRHEHQRFGSQHILDRLPANATPSRAAQHQTPHLRLPSGHQGGSRQGHKQHEATLPRPRQAQRGRHLRPSLRINLSSFSF